MGEKIVPDVTLDTFGLVCPMPIVKASKKLKEMARGQVLEVLSDDEGIRDDMPAWCRDMGQEFIGLEEDSGEFKVYVRKLR